MHSWQASTRISSSLVLAPRFVGMSASVTNGGPSSWPTMRRVSPGYETVPRAFVGAADCGTTSGRFCPSEAARNHAQRRGCITIRSAPP